MDNDKFRADIKQSCNLQEKVTAFNALTRKIVGNTKSLFTCLNKLIDNKQMTVLPSHGSCIELVERFKSHFKDKVNNIRKSFPTPNIVSCNASSFPQGKNPLHIFEPTTEDELKSIILSYGINCSPEDPIPVIMLKNYLDLFIPIWMDIVNLSLSQGSMGCLKNAILNPLIKALDNLIDT